MLTVLFSTNATLNAEAMLAKHMNITDNCTRVTNIDLTRRVLEALIHYICYVI